MKRRKRAGLTRRVTRQRVPQAPANVLLSTVSASFHRYDGGTALREISSLRSDEGGGAAVENLCILRADTGVIQFPEFQKLSEAPGIIDHEKSERNPMRVSYEREIEEKQPYQSS